MAAPSRQNAPPRYAYAKPTVDDALGCLARLVGDARARSLWARASAQVGFISSAATPRELVSVAQVLAKEPGLVAVAACTIMVRVNSYLALEDHGRLEEQKAPQAKDGAAR